MYVYLSWLFVIYPLLTILKSAESMYRSILCFLFMSKFLIFYNVSQSVCNCFKCWSTPGWFLPTLQHQCVPTIYKKAIYILGLHGKMSPGSLSCPLAKFEARNIPFSNMQHDHMFLFVSNTTMGQL